MPAIISIQQRGVVSPIDINARAAANPSTNVLAGIPTRLGVPTLNLDNGSGGRPTVTVTTVVTPTSNPASPISTSFNTPLPTSLPNPPPVTNSAFSPVINAPLATSAPVPTPTGSAVQSQVSNLNDHDVPASTKKGLAPGSIAGLVILFLILFAALGVFVYRKKAVQKRVSKRTLWTVKPYDIGGPTDFKKGEDAAAAFGGLGALGGLVSAFKGQGQTGQGRGEEGQYATTANVMDEIKAGDMVQVGQSNISVAALPNPYQPAHTHHRSSSGQLFVLGKPPVGGKGMKRKPSPKSISDISGLMGNGLPAGAAAPVIPGFGGLPVQPMPAASANTGRGSFVGTGVVTTVTPESVVGGTGGNVRRVKHTYLPSRGDEMGVDLGEEVKVLAEYDDGWAHCLKVLTGEKGMVPVACWEDDVEVGVGSDVKGKGKEREVDVEDGDLEKPRIFAEGREIRFSKRESSLQQQAGGQ
ncbi:hypothetical protein BDN72DRAFT_903180 [Pluteus cervinus]|uniref:Uncharacterized protein n=1 Tax=Pluteus cervinus TaxID=181527 RepID=A0ACD3A9G0_9AGAR|nr:hypothetical protein BDN72DRAFT_903180 [Pluteus cervinus]